MLGMLVLDYVPTLLHIIMDKVVNTGTLAFQACASLHTSSTTWNFVTSLPVSLPWFIHVYVPLIMK